jgi:hypothetical protein
VTVETATVACGFSGAVGTTLYGFSIDVAGG